MSGRTRGKRRCFLHWFCFGLEGEVEACKRGVALKHRESCDPVLPFFSCLFRSCDGGEGDLEKEKGEEK